MPCSPFVKKGCSYTLENDKVYLRDPEKNVILEGHDVGGLYYYHSRTVRVADSETTPKSGAPALGVPINHGVYFGLPSTGTVSAGATDFARRLLETHWAFGHLHFDKLRKMLGLKKGDNPDCPACTIAKSRMERLKHTYIRSTRPNHRLHVDMGFTKDKNYCFQLYLDDYTRESYIDLLT